VRVVNTLVGQAATRLLQHVDRSIIQTEAQLKADMEFIAHQAFLATGIPVNVRTGRALETLSLVSTC
jgi:hypothetical protein